jgi:hypothetical protein
MTLTTLAPASAAGIVTAFAASITAFGILLTGIAGILPLMHKVDRVHKIVNQQHTDLLRFQAALIQVLNDAGIPLPKDQSLNAPPTDR